MKNVALNPDVWMYILINAALILIKLHFIVWLFLALQLQIHHLCCVLRSAKWCGLGLRTQYSK